MPITCEGSAKPEQYLLLLGRLYQISWAVIGFAVCYFSLRLAVSSPPPPPPPPPLESYLPTFVAFSKGRFLFIFTFEGNKCYRFGTKLHNNEK